MSSVKLFQGSHQKSKAWLAKTVSKTCGWQVQSFNYDAWSATKVQVLLPKHAAGKAYTTFQDFADAPP